MAEDYPRNHQVLAFVSGKGGSGKTALALSMAEVLAGAEIRTLIIDLDMATHGATYFFADRIAPSTGVLQYLARPNGGAVPVDSMTVEIHDNLLFTPSNAQLDFRYETGGTDSPDTTYARLRNGLQTLIDYVTHELKVEVVIIDCQAGLSPAVEVALSLADRSVLVLEHDTISTDAATRLERQVADSLPSFHRWIINKLRVVEAKTYPEMTRTLQALNHLPPIPFDWEVRQAYGQREIPVKLDEPSTMLFAVLRVLKVILPEIRARIEVLEKERTNSVYRRYQDILESATIRRDEFREKMGDIDRKLRRRLGAAAISFMYLGSIVTAASVLALLAALDILPIASSFVWAITLAGGGVASVMYGYWNLIERRTTADSEVAREELERAIQETQQEIERFESYMYTRSEEFILDFGQPNEQEMLR